MTRIEAVLAAVVTALEGAGAPSGFVVHREPARPIEEDEALAGVVYPFDVSSDVVTHTPEVLELDLDLVTELRRRVTATERTAGATASSALDELLEWTSDAMRTAFTSGALGVRELELTRIEWDQKLNNVLHARAAIRWRVLFDALADDLSSGG